MTAEVEKRKLMLMIILMFTVVVCALFQPKSDAVSIF